MTGNARLRGKFKELEQASELLLKWQDDYTKRFDLSVLDTCFRFVCSVPGRGKLCVVVG